MIKAGRAPLTKTLICELLGLSGLPVLQVQGIGHLTSHARAREIAWAAADLPGRIGQVYGTRAERGSHVVVSHNGNGTA